jgi:hypothetical protein
MNNTCRWITPVWWLALASCSSASSNGDGRLPSGDGSPPGGDGRNPWERAPLLDRDAGPLIPPPPTARCKKGSGGTTVTAPRLTYSFKDSWHEGWLGSPSVVDLDGDGKREIIAPRHNLLIVWNADGSIAFKKDVGGRIWSSPVIADLDPGRPGLEIAVAARGKVYAWDAKGQPLSGFPTSFPDEMRALAAADIDGDGKLELVAATTNPLSKGDAEDVVIALRADGSTVTGFPPNTTGASGCDANCTIAGGFDQTVALGDLDGDSKADVLVPQDNGYMSLHRGNGVAFDAAPIFKDRKKFPGIRFLLDYKLAQQGYPSDEEVDNQAHFTNSAPAIADVDADGANEIVVLSSVQNASQSDRLRGVALWVVRKDGTRLPGWEAPFHAKDYLAGLWDFEDANVVGATNQVSVADLDAGSAGPEFVFAGFDGRIHCVSAQKTELWSTTYTTDARVLTGGVVIADLSGDGSPEIVFASYSPDVDKSHLFILDAHGQLLHKIALPKSGAMAVPTVADIEGDGKLEILINLKDGEEKIRQVLAYTVDSAQDNCLLWPTGRANLLRTGFVSLK